MLSETHGLWVSGAMEYQKFLRLLQFPSTEIFVNSDFVCIPAVKSALSILERSVPPFDSHNLAEELKVAIDEGKTIIEHLEACARRAAQIAADNTEKPCKQQEAAEKKLTSSINRIHFKESKPGGLVKFKDQGFSGTGSLCSRLNLSEGMDDWADDFLPYSSPASPDASDVNVTVGSALSTGSSDSTKFSSLSSASPVSGLCQTTPSKSSTMLEPKSVNRPESDPGPAPAPKSNKENKVVKEKGCVEHILPSIEQDLYEGPVPNSSPIGIPILSRSEPPAHVDAKWSLVHTTETKQPLGKSRQVATLKRSCPWGSHMADGKRNAFSLLMNSHGGDARKPKNF